MAIVVLTAMSTLLMVSGLICILMQLINTWSDPERH